jgi:hypothetical protein
MKRTLVFLFASIAMPTLATAQDETAKSVLGQYEEFRPSDAKLAMYELDWAPTLEAAKTRAAREKRPILLVVIHAQYGDIHAGHC